MVSISDPANKRTKPRSTNNDDTPFFCFAMISETDRKYGINACNKNGRSGLMQRLFALSRLSWAAIGSQSRTKLGWEPMPRSSLRCSVPSAITDEETIYVFRFNSGPGGNGRFMGVRRDRTLHMFALDPNGTAYDH